MVSNTTVYLNYVPNGIQTTFAIPFQYIVGDYTTIKVYTISAAGVKTLVSSGYSLSPDLVNPVNVIFTIAPAASVGKVRIERELPLTQLADYINLGQFNAEDHEKNLDRLVFLIQQLANSISNKLALNPYDEGTVNPVLGAIQPNKALVGAADGLSFSWLDPSTFVSGAKFYSGAGAPSVGLGTDTDLYLNLNSPYTLYKKTGGVWVSQGNLLGATGATGATGAPGSEFTVTTFNSNGVTATSKVRYAAILTQARTLQLPANPNAGDAVAVKDALGNFDTFNLTIDRNGQNIEGQSTNFVCDAPYGQWEFNYVNSTYGWVLV